MEDSNSENYHIIALVTHILCLNSAHGEVTGFICESVDEYSVPS